MTARKQLRYLFLCRPAHNQVVYQQQQGSQDGPSVLQCVIERDAGKTKGNADEPDAFFCLDFARGCCPLGAECSFLHRIPFGQDAENISRDFDIFERRRPDNSDDCSNTTLRVEGVDIPDLVQDPQAWAQLTDYLAHAFAEWGPVSELCLITEGAGFILVKYRWRASAEFAKEAMQGRNLVSQQITHMETELSELTTFLSSGHEFSAQRLQQVQHQIVSLQSVLEHMRTTSQSSRKPLDISWSAVEDWDKAHDELTAQQVDVSRTQFHYGIKEESEAKFLRMKRDFTRTVPTVNHVNYSAQNAAKRQKLSGSELVDQAPKRGPALLHQVVFSCQDELRSASAQHQPAQQTGNETGLTGFRFSSIVQDDVSDSDDESDSKPAKTSAGLGLLAGYDSGSD